jgi:fructose-bisphosphate aldolase / 2-amino-3,7-dideoxy-D-threo-hept-6-ulosonate synthase
MPMNAGKTRRMARLVDRGRTVILPLDIIVPVGRFEGAEDTGALVDMACANGVDAVLLRWGEAKRYADRIAPGAGLIVRVSGSTGVNDGSRWPVQLNSVEASLAIGGDAVCIDVEIGGGHEQESLQTLARVCEEAERLGLVVVAEIHVPTASPHQQSAQIENLAWGARTAQELGADLVKVASPGRAEAMAQICELAQIPVVMAGGDQREPLEVLRAVDEALRGGAAGTAIGRNVIGHPSPAAMQQAIVDLVHADRNLDEARTRLLSAVPAQAPA